MAHYDDLKNPIQKNYEVYNAFVDSDVYFPTYAPSGQALQESQTYISRPMEYSGYQQFHQQLQPQQTTNTSGFVNQDDVWREFTRSLGV